MVSRQVLSFFGNPLAKESRALSELKTVALADGKTTHRVAIAMLNELQVT